VATLLLVPTSSATVVSGWALLVYALFPVDPVVLTPGADGYLGTLT